MRYPVLPGSTVGILGGGQLGRMFAIAARRMGYRVHTLEPAPDSPAGQISDREITAPYDDLDAVRRFARDVDVISFEFENIPFESIRAAEEICPVRPRAEVLHICQNREREKFFLRRHGFPCADFEVVAGAEDLRHAVERIGTPAVLKTADFGYDGKGQAKLTDVPRSMDGFWRSFGAPRAVLEKWVPFEKELSVVVARGADGATECFPVSENIHTHHILDLSIVPARIPVRTARQAADLAHEIADALEVIGLVAVEMFLTPGGDLLVNELAPRPHNSGHFTFDACLTSQFEQQLRAACLLPLGSPKLLSPAVMWNILGNQWGKTGPDWQRMLSLPNARLHLYGKHEPRPGRKMGHLTLLGEVEKCLHDLKEFRTTTG